MAFPSTFLDIKQDVALKAHMLLSDATVESQIEDWINAAYFETCATTRCLQKTSTATMTAGVSSYTIDSEIHTIDLLTVSSWPWPLVETQLDEILNLRARGTTGATRYYAMIGLTQMEVWPTPTAADTMTFYYSYMPGALAQDGDMPVIPEPYASNCLGYGALVQAAEAKRDIMMLGDFQSQYNQSTQDFQKYLNRKSGSYPQHFPVVTGMSLTPFHDPSTDVPDYVGY